MASDPGMGVFRVDVEIGNPAGTRYERVAAVVDTGATYTSIPRPLLEALGVTPHARDVFVLADGRRVQHDIGRTWIRIGESAEITLVIFADARSPALLGAYALEGLRLAADPVGRRLVPIPGLLLTTR